MRAIQKRAVPFPIPEDCSCDERGCDSDRVLTCRAAQCRCGYPPRCRGLPDLAPVVVNGLERQAPAGELHERLRPFRARSMPTDPVVDGVVGDTQIRVTGKSRHDPWNPGLAHPASEFRFPAQRGAFETSECQRLAANHRLALPPPRTCDLQTPGVLHTRRKRKASERNGPVTGRGYRRELADVTCVLCPRYPGRRVRSLLRGFAEPQRDPGSPRESPPSARGGRSIDPAPCGPC